MNQRRGCLDTGHVVLVSVEEAALGYDFGKSHPLRPERVLHTYENIRALGLNARDNVREEASRSATDEEIVAVHDAAFVETVQGIDAGTLPSSRGFEFGLGTPDDPIFKDMHQASAAVAGASIVGAELVAEGSADHSFNPARGPPSRSPPGGVRFLRLQRSRHLDSQSARASATLARDVHRRRRASRRWRAVDLL